MRREPGLEASERRRPASSMMSACSACAGDYEDPDRTALEAESDEPWGEVTQEPEEFPAAK